MHYVLTVETDSWWEGEKPNSFRQWMEMILILQQNKQVQILLGNWIGRYFFPYKLMFQNETKKLSRYFPFLRKVKKVTESRNHSFESEYIFRFHFCKKGMGNVNLLCNIPVWFSKYNISYSISLLSLVSSVSSRDGSRRVNRIWISFLGLTWLRGKAYSAQWVKCWRKFKKKCAKNYVIKNGRKLHCIYWKTNQGKHKWILEKEVENRSEGKMM